MSVSGADMYPHVVAKMRQSERCRARRQRIFYELAVASLDSKMSPRL
jgi:hypothetical protein